MITIHIDNLTLILTPTCPRDLSDTAIRCLDRRDPERVKVEYDDEFKMPIPRFSPFVGQLGRLRP